MQSIANFCDIIVVIILIVDEWMDCGNKAITIETNQRMLGFLQVDGEEQLLASSAKLENANIIEPCFVGENVVLKNTTIGPFVSIGNGTVIENSTIENSLIQTNTEIKNAKLKNAMIGNNVTYNGEFTSISIGDYSVLE